MIKRLMFALLFSMQCSAMTFYYFDWCFIYFNSPDFIEACDAGEMGNEVPDIISKKIEICRKVVETKKGRTSLVMSTLPVEEIDPLFDVTSEIYQVMIGIK